jgi:hypothetical protein
MVRSRFLFLILAVSFLVVVVWLGPAAATDEAKTASKATCADPAMAATPVAAQAPAAAPAASATAKTPAHAYTGVGKCKLCHMPIYKAWAATPHAKAFSALDSTKKENQDPKCVKCHTTGFNKGGYTMAKSVVDFKGVQCEVCHGPGADYLKVMKDPVKAKAAGLIMPNQDVCVGCHNKESPNFKGFDYAAYLAKGVHKVPAAAKK